MGAAMRFITIGSSASGPHDGQKADEGGAHGHGLGAHALDRAMNDRLGEIAGRAQPALQPWLRHAARSRKSSMKTPVSASRPKSAINPTHTAMEML
jgi:hypothetical protein